jgi:hypothetical protein
MKIKKNNISNMMNVKHIHQVWGLKTNNIFNTPLLSPPSIPFQINQ